MRVALPRESAKDPPALTVRYVKLTVAPLPAETQFVSVTCPTGVLYPGPLEKLEIFELLIVGKYCNIRE